MNSVNLNDKVPVILSWSSGKDSAWALHLLREGRIFDVVALITTVDSVSGCVPVHGTQPEVLLAQADSVDLPLVTVPLKWPCSNAEYERALGSALEECRIKYNASYIAFGDLFLEDIRAYRAEFCERIGWQPVFPLWGMDTSQLALGMIEGGLQAVVGCVDTKLLPTSMSGMQFDQAFLADLPSGVDPCGENGEFHTIVYNSPDFGKPVKLERLGDERLGSLSLTRFGIDGR